MDFEDYVHHRRGALFGFAVVLTGDPVLADDIVGDVLGNAFERWDRVAAADNVHAYVRRMIVNEFLSWRRRRARTAPWADLSDLADPVGDPGDRYAERQALVVGLRRLPPRQRAALVLRYYEELSFAEIAEMLGVGENAIRSNVSRALRTLRVTLSDPQLDTDGRFPDPALEGR